jgi:hypothetical protein
LVNRPVRSPIPSIGIGRLSRPILYTYTAMSGARLRLWILLAMVALIALLGFQLARTHWSNNCDPQLARFTAMQNDPAVHERPAGTAIVIEIDQPDNGWLVCTDTNIDLYLMGTDNHSIYRDFNRYLSANGWAAVAPGTDPHFELYEKDTAARKWSASVFEQLAWVEVSISDYGGPVKTP